jgi:hypothetical protein
VSRACCLYPATSWSVPSCLVACVFVSIFYTSIYFNLNGDVYISACSFTCPSEYTLQIPHSAITPSLVLHFPLGAIPPTNSTPSNLRSSRPVCSDFGDAVVYYNHLRVSAVFPIFTAALAAPTLFPH